MDDCCAKKLLTKAYQAKMGTEERPDMPYVQGRCGNYDTYLPRVSNGFACMAAPSGVFRL
ncbi:hypothetical protein QJS10_CPB13g01222 [Acorus calamus]|uniref:Uncharacterized protein n=1 Tax=Acorus calamus TaxID=4465 RepID=A0AAV9DFP1_ACOCL|nr:hypothetical protein QJS10_CPB13g01222 [Acorus calamus]